jgi:hypothetical protein
MVQSLRSYICLPPQITCLYPLPVYQQLVFHACSSRKMIRLHYKSLRENWITRKFIVQKILAA